MPSATDITSTCRGRPPPSLVRLKYRWRINTACHTHADRRGVGPGTSPTLSSPLAALAGPAVGDASEDCTEAGMAASGLAPYPR
eukprot:COSAG01_NODE_6931_length_3435_cov_18.212530_7_plen_84_part_00